MGFRKPVHVRTMSYPLALARVHFSSVQLHVCVHLVVKFQVTLKETSSRVLVEVSGVYMLQPFGRIHEQ